MQYTTSLATAALALALPLILAYCANLQSTRQPPTYDAKPVGAPNSGAALELWLPPGTGPFPAVLVMHGYDGVRDHYRSWAGRLIGWGYAAAIVDSFGPRGLHSICERPDALQSAAAAQDAAAGDMNFFGDRSPKGRRATVREAGRPFQAAVAYYPGCSGGTIVSPYATDVLILIGKDDTVTTADRCIKTVAARAKQARPPAIKVYPGAVHAFDIGGIPRLSPLGYMFGGNAEAAADSFAMTEAFLTPGSSRNSSIALGARDSHYISSNESGRLGAMCRQTAAEEGNHA